MKRARKPKPAPVYEPNRCVTVCADPGATSGWCIRTPAGIEDFGECDVFAGGPSRVLEKGLEVARSLGLACVLVIERPFNRRPEQGGYNTTAVGTADKIWREMAKRLGFSKRVVRVYPSSWRAKTLDRGWNRLGRAGVRDHEQTKARALVSKVSSKHAGDDACPAILISEWPVYAGEVAAVLTKRSRKVG
jgi:hypothetical protein